MRVIQHRTRLWDLCPLQAGPSSACHHSGQGWHQVTPAPHTLTQLPRPPRWQPAALTLHDLLQLHLQGLHGPARVVASRALDAVDGQTPVHHGRHVVILQEDHTVGVLNDSTVGTQGTSHPALGSFLSSPCSSGVEEFPRFLKSGRSCEACFHPANGTGFFLPSSLLISGPT